jgi:hypothetical protein
LLNGLGPVPPQTAGSEDVQYENYYGAVGTMPLEYLDDPGVWLPYVDGKTVWIEGQP